MSDSIGYAVLSSDNLQLKSCDETFLAWLGDRDISELLPELNLTNEDTLPVPLCLIDSPATTAKVAINTLEGTERLLLLRVEIADAECSPEYRDAVTNLPDRRALEPHRQRWKCHAGGQAVPHALLFLDLNQFKQVNDRFGHATGDYVLTELAQRWQRSLRSSDLIVRYGGDEFVVLVAGIHNMNDARPVIARLRKAASEPISVGESSVAAALSIGAVFAADTNASLEELIDAADRKMYEEKRAGQ